MKRKQRRNIVLYIAMSLDGYIADQNGGVDWLLGDGSDKEHPGTYGEFISTIDTVVLGYNTYHQIVTELSPDAWVYTDKRSYVITHKDLVNKDNIVFTNDLIGTIIKLKEEEGKDVWICGGAGIINPLIKKDMIDRFCVTVIPTLLGQGIRLFDTLEEEIRLKLVSNCSYNGMTDLIYDRRS